MYLSCFHLKHNAPSVRQCLRDARDMHRSVMDLFPDVGGGNAREMLGVLYRLYRTDRELRLYVQSEDKPDATRLRPGFDMVDQPKELGFLQDSIAAGQTYLFDLLASPTKKKGTDAKNSKRVFLTSAENRLHWLKRKAADAGFSLEWVREEGQETILACIADTDTQITSVGVHFRGVLKVQDISAFRKAWAEGIGPGKAYGLGMLLLADPANG